MKKVVMSVLVIMLLLLTVMPALADVEEDSACWGQASSVFAQMGVMGEHSSAQETPRLGLANLARELYEAGAIADDSIQALGAFVAAELGLSLEACY